MPAMHTDGRVRLLAPLLITVSLFVLAVTLATYRSADQERQRAELQQQAHDAQKATLVAEIQRLSSRTGTTLTGGPPTPSGIPGDFDGDGVPYETSAVPPGSLLTPPYSYLIFGASLALGVGLMILIAQQQRGEASSKQEAVDLILGHDNDRHEPDSLEEQSETNTTSLTKSASRTTLEEVLNTASRQALGYHQLTKEEARHVRRSAVRAMTMFALILGGLLILVTVRDATAEASVWVLTAGATFCASYVTATFMRTYRAALTELRYFFSDTSRSAKIVMADQFIAQIADQNARDAAYRDLAKLLLDKELARDLGTVDFGKPSDFTSPQAREPRARESSPTE